MSQCVYRLENTLSPVLCENEAQVGGFCAEHRMKNPNEQTRCLRMIPPGGVGNELGTTDVRCEGVRIPGRSSYCVDHQTSADPYSPDAY